MLLRPTLYSLMAATGTNGRGGIPPNSASATSARAQCNLQLRKSNVFRTRVYRSVRRDNYNAACARERGVYLTL